MNTIQRLLFACFGVIVAMLRLPIGFVDLLPDALRDALLSASGLNASTPCCVYVWLGTFRAWPGQGVFIGEPLARPYGQKS